MFIEPPFKLVAESVVEDILAADTLELAENILTEYFEEMFDSGKAAGQREAIKILETMAAKIK